MTTGLQVINDFGSYQIDEYYQNLFLEAKYTITKDKFKMHPNGDFYFYDLPFVSQTPPIIAVGVYQGIQTAYYGMTKVGNQYVAKIVSSSNVDVNVYVFNTLSNPKSSYGLQVFNADGDLIFDASKKPLRLVSIQDQDSTDTAILGQNREYAVCHNLHRIKRVMSWIDVWSVGSDDELYYPHRGVGSFTELYADCEVLTYFSSATVMDSKIWFNEQNIVISRDYSFSCRGGILTSGHPLLWLDVVKIIEKFYANGWFATAHDLRLLPHYYVPSEDFESISENYQFMIIDVTNY